MALVQTPTVNEGPLFAEVEMSGDSLSSTVRATVVQASTIFYDTPATLGQSAQKSYLMGFDFHMIWCCGYLLVVSV